MPAVSGQRLGSFHPRLTQHREARGRSGAAAAGSGASGGSDRSDGSDGSNRSGAPIHPRHADPRDRTSRKKRPVRVNPQREVAPRGRQDTPVRSGLAGRGTKWSAKSPSGALRRRGAGMVSCPADYRRDCDTTTSGAVPDACPREGVFPQGRIYPHRSPFFRPRPHLTRGRLRFTVFIIDKLLYR